MIKKIRNTICLTLCALFIVSFAGIPASASTAVYTNNYYVYGYKTYGKLTFNNGAACATTYCEQTKAGKLVKLSYKYKNTAGEIIPMTVGTVSASSASDYYVNNKTTYSTPTVSPSDFKKLVSASSQHKVVVFANGNHYWSSKASGDTPKLPVS